MDQNVNTRIPSPTVGLPDNRCCFILNLKQGTIIVAVINCLLSSIIFSWYFTTQSSVSHRNYITELDVVTVIVFVLQVVVNAILVYGAIRKSPLHTVPWLCVNFVVMVIFMVLVALLLFFGYIYMSLTYDEYVGLLSIIGCLAAGHLFSCMVVFQFRKNLIEEIYIRRSLQDECTAVLPEISPRRSSTTPSLPPSYEEVSASKGRKEEPSAPPPAYYATTKDCAIHEPSKQNSNI